ncbi:MAG TPA: DUF6152 family protein [Terriglobia bacterium]|nr:DUF6152 family protein [Terriglobia bacterium]
MKTSIAVLLCGIAVLFCAAPLFAHHSFSAEFDGKQRIQLTGVVTKIEWTNPHVWFYVNVMDEATGKLVNWGAEMGSPNALIRTGWTRNTMKVGMVVSFNGSRSKDGSYRVNTSSVSVDGKKLGAASSENQPEQP